MQRKVDNKELLSVVLDALDRLLRMFTVERYVYLALTGVSFLMLIFVAYQLLTANSVDKSVLLTVFGSSGLIAASSARISWFFNRAFTLVESIVKRISP